MPYSKIEDLPEGVQGLPIHAQRIWLEAFNSAWEDYPDDEERCAKIAWGAVKNAGYEKNEETGEWTLVEKKESKRYIQEEHNIEYTLELKEATIGEDGNIHAVLHESGMSDNRHQGMRVYYPEATVENAAPVYQGAKMFLNHPTPAEIQAKERDIKRWVATVASTKGKDGKVEGVVHIHDPWLKEMILDPVFRKEVNLSHHVLSRDALGKIGVERCWISKEIKKVFSVDFTPAGEMPGCRLTELMESRRGDLDLLSTITIEDLNKLRPDLVAKEIEMLVHKENAADPDPSKDAKVKELEKQNKQLKEQMVAKEIETEVSKSDLPKVSKDRVITQLKQTVTDVDPTKVTSAVQESIKLEKEYIAGLTGKPKVKNMGNTDSDEFSVQNKAKRIIFKKLGLKLDDGKEKDE